MALVDDRGRLFGRFNLIDAVVAIFVLGLIPLLYGAAALFWQPLPTLKAVDPPQLATGPGQHVTIRGENLRPYMRVSFGTYQGVDFLFRSTTEAEVKLPDIPPGVYDVVLYDVAQEQARREKGLTILPAPVPATSMTLVGVLGNLDAERAKSLTPGTEIKGIGTIRKVAEPMPARFRINSNGLIVQIPVEKAVMLPVEIESFCEVKPIGGQPYCQAQGMALQPTMMISGESTFGTLPFQIDLIRGREPLVPIEITVNFANEPVLLSQLHVGDVDMGTFANPLAFGAEIIAIASKQPRQVEAKLRLNAARGSIGWLYAAQPLKAGGALTIRTGRYEMPGQVMMIKPEWTPAP